jgi:hypothetical protein
MCWELETDPNRISTVLGTRIVGIRTVTLAEPNEGGFDIMEIMKAGAVLSMGHFLKRSARVAEVAGVHRLYELRIHDYPKPYVSVYERCQRKHIGMFFWSSDTEPLNSGDERMQLLACKLDERLQGSLGEGKAVMSSDTDSVVTMRKSENRPMQIPKPSLSKERTSKISRNAPCPCGSGRKYKHCCISTVTVSS